MPLVQIPDVAGRLRGKRIAIVCNDPLILHQEFGEQIDSFDFVLRMNRAFPTRKNQKAIGSRTDIMTGGWLHPIKHDWPKDPTMIWWFKHTYLGGAHLNQIVKACPELMVLHVPKELILDLDREMRLKDGFSTSSGPAALRAAERCEVAEAHVFGMTCWGRLGPGKSTHWWQFTKDISWPKNAPFTHDADSEANWLKERLHEIEPFHHVYRPVGADVSGASVQGGQDDLSPHAGAP